jgi:Family of unknown function (DUF5684)
MLGQTTITYSSGGSSGAFWGVYALVWIFFVVCWWRIFTKAGRPGWAAIIPFYNWYIMIKVAGRPGWWLILLFIPIVNIVIYIIVAVDIAKNFGHTGWFALGMILLSIIFLPILAFEKSTYRPIAHGAAPAAPAAPPVPPPPPS